jgi:radical SAM protein with 4Fe4S-binding SPASM domain
MATSSEHMGSRQMEAYRTVLHRPPSARERHKWTAYLSGSLLRWRLKQMPEYRAGIAPFRSDAESILRALGVPDVDSSSEHLLDQWRRVLHGARPVWTPFELPSRDVLEARTEAVEKLFEDVLQRPADEPARHLFVARWCLGLDDLDSLRRELCAGDEHDLVERIRRAAAQVLSRVGLYPGQVEEIGLFLQRWRATGADPDAAPPSPTDEMISERSASIEALFDEILLRPPDEATRRRFLARWLLGLEELESIRSELAESREHRSIVRPLLDIIDDVHKRYRLEPPSPKIVRDAIDRVRTDLRTQDELTAAIADGTVVRKLGIRPLKLEMDVTTQCNLRCTMCYLSDPRYGKRARLDVDVAGFRQLARQIFPFCGLVSLSFGTEPLLHPHLAELLELVAEEEVPWRYVITNGLLLDAELIDAFVRIPLHGFSVSIDAATPATYERIRRGASWTRLMSNIRALQAAKSRAGSQFPRVTFNFVIMRSNLEELPALVRLAHELGAEGVSATHLTPFEGLDLEDELLSGEPERLSLVLAATRAEGERLGVPVALPDSFQTGSSAPRVLKEEIPAGFLFPPATREKAPCPFPWQFVGIDPYGNVVPCGWWYTEPPLGNIRRQSFDEIWEGDAWRELRREHETGELRTLCRECPAAGMGSCDNPRAFRTVTLGLARESSRLLPTRNG